MLSECAGGPDAVGYCFQWPPFSGTDSVAFSKHLLMYRQRAKDFLGTMLIGPWRIR